MAEKNTLCIQNAHCITYNAIIVKKNFLDMRKLLTNKAKATFVTIAIKNVLLKRKVLLGDS